VYVRAAQVTQVAVVVQPTGDSEPPGPIAPPLLHRERIRRSPGSGTPVSESRLVARASRRSTTGSWDHRTYSRSFTGDRSTRSASSSRSRIEGMFSDTDPPLPAFQSCGRRATAVIRGAGGPGAAGVCPPGTDHHRRHQPGAFLAQHRRRLPDRSRDPARSSRLRTRASTRAPASSRTTRASCECAAGSERYRYAGRISTSMTRHARPSVRRHCGRGGPRHSVAVGDRLKPSAGPRSAKLISAVLLWCPDVGARNTAT
jgi:hypothetical protein